MSTHRRSAAERSIESIRRSTAIPCRKSGVVCRLSATAWLSFATVEIADLRAGTRGASISMCEREHRSSGIPVPVVRAGTPRSGGSGNGATIEVRTLSKSENTGNIRLQESAVTQQDTREPVDDRGVHRRAGVDYPDRSAGNGKDAPGSGTGN